VAVFIMLAAMYYNLEWMLVVYMAAIFRYGCLYNYVCKIIAFVNFQEIKETFIYYVSGNVCK